MHTFELICNISFDAYDYLHNNLPGLSNAGKYVERTNYYSAKGITQIELRTFEFLNGSHTYKKFYLVLRCNPSIIMGDSKVFVLDLERYTPTEVIERIHKRLYEINEFRYIQLFRFPTSLFRVNRADIARDITVASPGIMVWLCNMSFPYHYRNMKRKHIHKEIDTLYFESCYFASKSRIFNLYDKCAALKNTGKPVEKDEEGRIQHTLRFEIQIHKKGISYLATRLPTKREIQPFLDKDFCHDYLKKEAYSLFSSEKYVCKSQAIRIITDSCFKPYEKAVMLSIIDMIHSFNGLYELEQAIDGGEIFTPPAYGNLRTFRERWLKKIRSLGIQPIVIPDEFGYKELPSLYEFLTTTPF